MSLEFCDFKLQSIFVLLMHTKLSKKFEEKKKPKLFCEILPQTTYKMIISDIFQ